MNVPRIILAILFATLSFIFVKLVNAEEEKPRLVETYIVYTDDRGVTHYTDSWKSVPDRYRDQAKEGSWEDLHSRTDQQITESQASKPKRLFSYKPEEKASTEPEDSCQPFHTELKYKEFDGYTRQYFVLVDACGKERGFTLDSEPEIKAVVE